MTIDQATLVTLFVRKKTAKHGSPGVPHQVLFTELTLFWYQSRKLIYPLKFEHKRIAINGNYFKCRTKLTTPLNIY